jgi:signal transduction histidine kinase
LIYLKKRQSIDGARDLLTSVSISYDVLKLAVAREPGVTKTAVESLPTGSGQDHLPVVIAAMPISARERRIAFSLIIVLAVIDVMVAPFANVRLARADGFIPAVQTVMCVIDLLTATLLFAQYSIYPARALLAVASGYVFSGLFAFIQTLAFPGVYSSTGLIGDGLNSAAWIFALWHTTFPLTLIIYALAKDRRDVARLSSGSIAVNLTVTVAFVLVTTAVLTWLAVNGATYLPALYFNTLEQTPSANNVNIFLWAANLAAFVLLFVRRRTILDLWLIVVLFAWWPNFLVAIFETYVRFSAGWYVARVVALVASSTLLVVLLAESSALYARLTNAYLLLRRERADRLVSVEAATAAMAHEVRQPLTAIATRGTAGLNWLKRTPPDLNRASECLDSMVDATHRANEIITAIRGLFKDTPTQRVMIQINDICSEVLNLVQDDLRVGTITATAEYQENLPQIYADHTQMQQVILNLVRNAIEAMRSGSSDNRRLRLVTGFDEKSSVSVYIQDSGDGIAPEFRDRIFDPFFTTKPGGTGLGLSICRAIAEEHGGALRLSKTDSHGTSFELIFPIGSASDNRTAVRPARSKANIEE